MPMTLAVYSLPPASDVYGTTTLLVSLTDALEKAIRIELDGTGSGSFAISRYSAQATAENLAQGNLVTVAISEVDADPIFAFFLESGDFTLISTDEEGGELLRFGGRGILSYLSNGIAWAGSFIPGGDPAPPDGLVRAYAAGTGHEPGMILMRLIDEFQDPDRPQAPIPLVTYDFDYTDDSDGNAWTVTAATDEFTYKVGDPGCDIVLALIEAAAGDLVVQMDPDFTLHAWNSYERDLTGGEFGAGVVRFVKGVNIASELRRDLALDRVVTHMLVGGETDHYGTAALSDAASRVTKEGFVPSFGTNTAALDAVGAAELTKRVRSSDVISFPIANRRAAGGLGATAGFYLPGPPGSTGGDFWVGDRVRLQTGATAFDYDEATLRVMAVNIAEEENAELAIVPELVELVVPPPLTCSTSLANRAYTLAEGDGGTASTANEVISVSGSVTTTAATSLVMPLLFSRNGDSPQDHDATTPSGYTLLASDYDSPYSRVPMLWAYDGGRTPGSQSASLQYNSGFGGTGWSLVMLALATSAAAPVQWKKGSQLGGGNFGVMLDSTPRLGNILIAMTQVTDMYSLTTPAGWTQVMTDHIVQVPTPSRYSQIAVYLRCVQPGDTTESFMYAFDGGSGGGADACVFVAEWAIS